jgi:hypothetical protein
MSNGLRNGFGAEEAPDDEDWRRDEEPSYLREPSDLEPYELGAAINSGQKTATWEVLRGCLGEGRLAGAIAEICRVKEAQGSGPSTSGRTRSSSRSP